MKNGDLVTKFGEVVDFTEICSLPEEAAHTWVRMVVGNLPFLKDPCKPKKQPKENWGTGTIVIVEVTPNRYLGIMRTHKNGYFLLEKTL